MSVDLPPPDPRERVDGGAAEWDGPRGRAGGTPRLGLVLAAVVVGLLAVGGGLALLIGVLADMGEVTSASSPEQAFRQTLDLIDRSERTMLDYQRAEARAAGPELGPDGSGELGPDAAEAVASAAATARDELADLRDRLDAAADGAGEEVQDLRDAYVEHLEAWRDLLGRIADDPAVAVEGGEDQFADINSTGDAFVEAVDAAVSEDTPADIREQARAIIERGFRSPEDSGGTI